MMLFTFAVFAVSLFINVFYGFNIAADLVIAAIAVFISLAWKKWRLIVFCFIGIILGGISSGETHKAFEGLPEKGFVDIVLKITDLPEFRPDGRYQAHSYSIKIISSNANLLYKGQMIRLRGYLTRYHFNGQDTASIYAVKIVEQKEGPLLFRAVARLRDFVNLRILSVKE